MSEHERHPAEDVEHEAIEMLSQPLLTDEGFLNEACVRELEATIRSIPPTHERLSNDPEWNTAWPVTLGKIIGAFAGCAVNQMSEVPPDLENVTSYLRACLIKGPFADDHDDIRIASLSLCEINKFLYDTLEGLAQFDNWNKEEVVGSKWIDLDALLRNVCVQIRDDWRHMLAFDRRFERRYGGDK